MIISQFSISPISEGASVSKYVKIVIEQLKKEKMNFETNPMATVIETNNLDELFDIIKKAHQKISDMGVKRIITEIKIDDRLDKNATMKSKLISLK